MLLNVLYSHLVYFPKFCLIHFVYYLNLILFYHVTLNHLRYLILFLVGQCLVYFISFLRFSFFFNDAYLIVSFLTVPFIISHSVFGFASLLIVAISLMLSLIVC